MEKGLIRTKTIKEIQLIDSQINASKEETGMSEPELVQHVKRAFTKNKDNKSRVDQRLKNCLRARKGEYEPEALARMMSLGGSEPIYIKVTGTKCRAASSWMRDIVLPVENDYPFSVIPTPEAQIDPKIEVAIKQKAANKLASLALQGQDLGTLEIAQFFQDATEEAQKQIQTKAGQAAERMELKIKDKMAEGNWNLAMEEFIEDFVTYPSAFMKGPYFKKKRVLSWAKGMPKVSDEITMSFRRIPPWDVYPSEQAKNLNEGDLIEVVRYSRSQLYALKGVDGYNESEIDNVLECENPENIKWIEFENFERNQLENNSSTFVNHDDVITSFHYWGTVRGRVLKEWGAKGILDENDFYEADVIIIGNYVIRAVINDNPIGLRPYHFACWDKLPGSIWGVALPEQMEEHQKIINGCARSLVDNMSLSAGPQTVVMVDQLAPGQNPTNITPFKVWQGMTPLVGGATSKPIDFFVVPSVAPQLLDVMDRWENKTDDVTNIPRYSYGNQNLSGGASTATGLQTLMTAAAKGIRRAVASIDSGVIQPVVYLCFIQLMLHDADKSIKGDVKIVPKGVSAILIKEQQQNKILAFLREAGQMMGPNTASKLMSESAKLLDLNIDDELKADNQLRAQQEQAAQEQAQMEAAAKAGGMPAQAQQGMAMQQSVAQAGNA